MTKNTRQNISTAFAVVIMLMLLALTALSVAFDIKRINSRNTVDVPDIRASTLSASSDTMDMIRSASDARALAPPTYPSTPSGTLNSTVFNVGCTYYYRANFTRIPFDKYGSFSVNPDLDYSYGCIPFSAYFAGGVLRFSICAPLPYSTSMYFFNADSSVMGMIESFNTIVSVNGGLLSYDSTTQEYSYPKNYSISTTVVDDLPYVTLIDEGYPFSDYFMVDYAFEGDYEHYYVCFHPIKFPSYSVNNVAFVDVTYTSNAGLVSKNRSFTCYDLSANNGNTITYDVYSSYVTLTFYGLTDLLSDSVTPVPVGEVFFFTSRAFGYSIQNQRILTEFGQEFYSRTSLQGSFTDAFNNGYSSGYSDGVTAGTANSQESYNKGYDAGKSDGYTSGYNEGVNIGNSQGFNKGLQQGKNEGYTDGYGAGRTEGYNSGVIAGAASANNYTFMSLIAAVIDAPITAITKMLDFEILGFNMTTFFLSLFTVAIILKIVSFVTNGSGS